MHEGKTKLVHYHNTLEMQLHEKLTCETLVNSSQSTNHFNKKNALHKVVVDHIEISEQVCRRSHSALPFAMNNFKGIDLHETFMCRISIFKPPYHHLESHSFYNNNHLIEIEALPMTIKLVKSSGSTILKNIKIHSRLRLMSIPLITISLCFDIILKFKL